MKEAVPPPVSDGFIAEPSSGPLKTEGVRGAQSVALAAPAIWVIDDVVNELGEDIARRALRTIDRGRLPTEEEHQTPQGLIVANGRLYIFSKLGGAARRLTRLHDLERAMAQHAGFLANAVQQPRAAKNRAMSFRAACGERPGLEEAWHARLVWEQVTDSTPIESAALIRRAAEGDRAAGRALAELAGQLVPLLPDPRGNKRGEPEALFEYLSLLARRLGLPSRASRNKISGNLEDRLSKAVIKAYNILSPEEDASLKAAAKRLGQDYLSRTFNPEYTSKKLHNQLKGAPPASSIWAAPPWWLETYAPVRIMRTQRPLPPYLPARAKAGRLRD